MFGDRKFTGHSMKRPPKKCTVCRKPLSYIQAKIKWSEREARKNEICQCERCLHKLMDRTPGVCEECKAREETSAKEKTADDS